MDSRGFSLHNAVTSASRFSLLALVSASPTIAAYGIDAAGNIEESSSFDKTASLSSDSRLNDVASRQEEPSSASNSTRGVKLEVANSCLLEKEKKLLPPSRKWASRNFEDHCPAWVIKTTDILWNKVRDYREHETAFGLTSAAPGGKFLPTSQEENPQDLWFFLQHDSASVDEKIGAASPSAEARRLLIEEKLIGKQDLQEILASTSRTGSTPRISYSFHPPVSTPDDDAHSSPTSRTKPDVSVGLIEVANGESTASTGTLSPPILLDEDARKKQEKKVVDEKNSESSPSSQIAASSSWFLFHRDPTLKLHPETELDLNAVLLHFFYIDWTSHSSFGVVTQGLVNLKKLVVNTKRDYVDLKLYISDSGCTGNDVDGYKTFMPDVLVGIPAGSDTDDERTQHNSKKNTTAKKISYSGTAVCYVQYVEPYGYQYIAEWLLHDQLSVLNQMRVKSLQFPDGSSELFPSQHAPFGTDLKINKSDKLATSTEEEQPPALHVSPNQQCEVNYPSWGWQAGDPVLRNQTEKQLQAVFATNQDGNYVRRTVAAKTAVEVLKSEQETEEVIMG
ncbi:unnamed protein product [Amoebophrya sp. A25]|nr:unnamed protein product [Amoebophrya sp. A25]|eukprot:GSA25T00013952001.1